MPASSSPTLVTGLLGRPIDQLAEIIRQSAQARPEGVALRDRDRETTFAQVDARSSRFAQVLLAQGVVPGDRVALVCSNNPYFLEILYGASKVGAIVAPINTRLAPDEVTALLGVCQPRVLFIGPDNTAATPPQHVLDTVHCTLDASAYEALIADQPDTDPGYRTSSEDTGVILFSSGTTGLPKGIELSAANFGASMTGEFADATSVEGTAVTMAPVPFFHVTGMNALLSANIEGDILLLTEPRDTEDLIRLLVDEGVTHAVGVPALLQRITQHPNAQTADWSQLAFFAYGGAPMPAPVMEAAVELMGCGLVQGYGLTETCGAVTSLLPVDHLPGPRRAQRLASVGRAISSLELRIVDVETREALPAGSWGEVQVRGANVTRGYWNLPEETEQVLVDGWLSTGDGGTLDEDGYLFLHDRIKDMIVSGGENVYPAEVESALSAHPAIAEIAIIGVPSEEWGESAYAVVVRRPGATLTESELIAWSREHIAHFKCPVGVAFVDQLPRNANGKLLKRSLRDQHPNPA